MRDPLKLLAAAGRHGPALLCGGVLVGLAAPPLAELARPLMGLAVFVFTLGAFLKVDGAAFRSEATDRRAVLLVLAWTAFGVPLATYGLVQVLRPGPDLSQGLLLCFLAPPVGSAAAIAAMLGLSAPLALLATVAATVAVPLYLPPLAASLAGAELAIDPLALSARLAVIVGGAASVAWLLRRCAGAWVAANPHAMTGVSVLGLILVAVGAMRGMQGHVSAAPAQAVALLGAAFLANAGFQAAGALLFAGLGRDPCAHRRAGERQPERHPGLGRGRSRPRGAPRRRTLPRHERVPDLHAPARHTPALRRRRTRRRRAPAGDPPCPAAAPLTAGSAEPLAGRERRSYTPPADTRTPPPVRTRPARESKMVRK